MFASPIQTNVITRTNISGTSFTVDVTALNLSPTLTYRDFQVVHNGVDVSSLYTKLSSTSLQYNGVNVTLGTTINLRRRTPVVQSETTFITTTTATQLTNGLTKLLLRTEELEGRLASSIPQQYTLPLSDAAYAPAWDNDVLNAPSKNAVYDKIFSVDAAVNLRAPSASPTFTGTPSAPTPTWSDSSTRLATTAYTKADSGWQALTLQNSWVGSSSGFPAPRIRRSANGMVELNGLMNRSGSPPAVSSKIADLPLGYAPDNNLLLTCYAGTNANDIIVRIDVNPQVGATPGFISWVVYTNTAGGTITNINYLGLNACWRV